MAKKQGNVKPEDNDRPASTEQPPVAHNSDYTADTNFVVTKPDGGKINVRARNAEEAIAIVRE